jgi:hypothetical protein
MTGAAQEGPQAREELQIVELHPATTSASIGPGRAGEEVIGAGGEGAEEIQRTGGRGENDDGQGPTPGSILSADRAEQLERSTRGVKMADDD